MRCIDKAIGCESFGSESESSATSGVFSRRAATVTGPNAEPPSAPACRVVSPLVGTVGARATKHPLLPRDSIVQPDVSVASHDTCGGRLTEERTVGKAGVRTGG